MNTEEIKVSRSLLKSLLTAHDNAASPRYQDMENIRAALLEGQHAEVLGERCIDGGTCHHQCVTRCFRRESCTHFSDYSGPWAYADTTSQPIEQQADPAPAQNEREALRALADRLQKMCETSLRGRNAADVRDVWRDLSDLLRRPAQAEQQPVAISKADHVAGEIGYVEFLQSVPYESKLYGAPVEPEASVLVEALERIKSCDNWGIQKIAQDALGTFFRSQRGGK